MPTKLTTILYRRLFNNASWSLASQVIGKGGAFVANIYLARVLGVENFGMFVFAQSITVYFWVMADLGINMYGIREIARQKDNRSEIISVFLSLRIATGTVIFILYSLTLLIFFDLDMTQKLTFIGSSLYLLTNSACSDWAFKGMEKFGYYTLGTTISSLSFLAGTLFFVRGEQDIAKAAFVWSLSFLMSSGILLWSLYSRFRINVKLGFWPAQWWLHLKESIFFTIAGGINILYQASPIFLLKLLATTREVGLFSAPYRTIFALSTLGSVVAMSLYPALCNYYKTDKKLFYSTQRFLFRMSLASGLALGTACLFFGSFIIGLLFGDKYVESVQTFRVLAIMASFYLVGMGFGIPIAAMGLQRLRVYVSTISLIICVVLSVVLIPGYGIEGAAFSLGLAELASLLMLIGIYIYHSSKQIK